MINVEDAKKKIIEFLNTNGPSLPISISSYIKLEPVFTSAILSELSSVHKLELSNMRVGSSRIYYLKGQESGLEKFADEHFSGVVKRAYLLLKDAKLLVDSEQEPAIRVALRSLKDFAIPFSHEDKIIWRYAFIPIEEIKKLINKYPIEKSELSSSREELSLKEEPSPKEELSLKEESSLKEEPLSKEEPSSKEELSFKEELSLKEEPSAKEELSLKEESSPKEEPLSKEEPSPKEDSVPQEPTKDLKEGQETKERSNNKTSEEKYSLSNKINNSQNKSDLNNNGSESNLNVYIKKNFNSPFEDSNKKELNEKSPISTNTGRDNLSPKNDLSKNIINYLNRKKIKLLSILEDSKNEFNCLIKINSDIGEISSFLISKNKKSISDQDLLLAHQKTIEYKMPCLFLYNGKLTKKVDELREHYKNIVIFKKYE
jgi:hypothetical protein